MDRHFNGSALSAHEFYERSNINAAIEKRDKELENAGELIKQLRAALQIIKRNLLRTQKSDARGMTLTHRDGNTTLHAVRNVCGCKLSFVRASCGCKL